MQCGCAILSSVNYPALQYVSTEFDICGSVHLGNIRGDSEVICNTLGNDSMCDSNQKSSYKHVSDFGRVRSYGHFF
jgi:hypothetical protein